MGLSGPIILQGNRLAWTGKPTFSWKNPETIYLHLYLYVYVDVDVDVDVDVMFMRCSLYCISQ